MSRQVMLQTICTNNYCNFNRRSCSFPLSLLDFGISLGYLAVSNLDAPDYVLLLHLRP